jgi:DNA-binding SARP family transcriptional activator/TolB-like protein
LDAPDAGPLGRAGQPRRLAVLALLALTRDRTLRRDQIIALLWPDRTEDAARRLLSSVVYDLRAVLGEAALEASGDSLTLKRDALDVDALRFDAAVRAKRWADAIALHTGDLLAGIDLEGSAELEQLIDERREHFLSEYAQALEREGERLAAIGEADRAIEAWSRLADARPYEAGIVLRLARAMDAQGDRAAAVERARLYGDRVRRDLEVDPDPAVVALMEELRSRPAVVPNAPPPGRGDAARASASLPAADSLVAEPKWLVRRLQWLVGIAAVVMLVLVRTLGGRIPQHPSSSGQVHLAVFPFVIVGDSEYRYLGDGMTRLLSTDLDGGGRLVTVSPAAVIGAVGPEGAATDVDHLRVIANDLGAQQFVTGTATAKGERLRLTAVIHSITGTTADPTEVAVEGPAADLPGLVDSLSVRLLVGEARPTERLIRIAAATTASLPALKAYLRGERFFQEGAYAAAAGAFDRATRIDPAFALAHYRCSLATLWADLPGTSTAEHDAQAVRFAENLAPRDRELVLAYSAWRSGDAAEAERRYQALWARYPDDVEAGFQLAETMFHYGPLMGRPIEEARGVFLEVLRIDPHHRGARWHLALMDGAPDRRADLRKDLLALAPTSGADVEVKGMSLRIDGKPLGADSLLRAAAPGQLWSLGWRLAVNLRDFDGADEAFRLITQMEPPVRSQGFRGQALLRLARGRWDADGEPGLESAALTLDGLVVNQVFAPPAAGITRLLESARIALAGTDSSIDRTQAERIRLVSAIGRLSLALHDSAGALAARAVLARLGDTTGAHSLDAFLAARAGRFDEALRQLDSARRNVWFGLAVGEPYYGQQAERFLRAEVLLAQGKLEEALRWYGGFGEFALDDLPYLARAEQRRAEIYERLGRPAEAVKSLEHAAELWSDADPLLVPHATEVRHSLARLSSPSPS